MPKPGDFHISFAESGCKKQGVVSAFLETDLDFVFCQGDGRGDIHKITEDVTGLRCGVSLPDACAEETMS